MQTLLMVNKTDLRELFQEFIREAEKNRAREENTGMKDLMSVPEACDLFQCSRGTIENWQKRGLLRCVYIGRRKYISKEEIRRLGAGNRQLYGGF